MADANPADYQPPKPDPKLKRLDFFVGKWQLKGRMKESPLGPARELKGWHTWKWLNEYFLEHRWGQELGEGVEYIGYDAPNKRFHTHYFDNNGPYDEEGSTYEGNFRGNNYVQCGPARLTYMPSADGKTIKFTGEMPTKKRSQGLDVPDSDWADLIEATFTKVE